MKTDLVDASYAYCRRMANEHYENFPIASWFVGAGHRRHFFAVYAFLRSADDIADNASLSVHERLQLLLGLEWKLRECYRSTASDPIFIALSDTITRREIPIEPFLDLLNAFKVDLFKNRYRTFDELLEYCRFSANPVGQIVLHIWGYHRHPRFEQIRTASDEICTGLQLVNHWQDVFIDRKINRLYLPLEDIDHYGYSLDQWEKGIVSASFKDLMAFQVNRARSFFVRGKLILQDLRPLHRLHISLVRLGGMRILDRIERISYDVLASRPELGWRDGAVILWNLTRLN